MQVSRYAIAVATYPDGRRIAFENRGYQTPEGKRILSKVSGTERDLPLNREEASAWVKELSGDLSQNARRELVEMLCEDSTD